MGYLLISSVLLVGCAAKQPPVMSPADKETASAALAFDPPIAMNEPALDLSRSTRGVAAFAGFEDTTTTYFDVYTDDRQSTDLTDRFVREGISEKVGATHR